MSAQGISAPLALFGRLTWMLLGPLALLIATFCIVSWGGGCLTGADIGYFVILTVMLLGRWLEFQGGHAEKATGEPATRTDLVRYVLVAGGIGLAVWVAANFLGNHWLVT